MARRTADGGAGEWAERARRALGEERKEVSLRWARAVTETDPGAAVAPPAPLAEDHPLDELVAAVLIEALQAHVHLGLTVPLSRLRLGRELAHAVRAMELFRQAGDAVGERGR